MGIFRDTPVILRDKEGNIILKKIGDIRIVWFYNTEKKHDEGFINYEIWSYKGWTSINKITRYKTDNDIYKIMSCYGTICTDNKDIDYIYGLLPVMDRNYDISKLNMSEKQLLHYIYESNESKMSFTDMYLKKPGKAWVKIGKTDTYLYNIEVDNEYYHVGIGNVNISNLIQVNLD